MLGDKSFGCWTVVGIMGNGSAAFRESVTKRRRSDETESRCLA